MPPTTRLAQLCQSSNLVLEREEEEDSGNGDQSGEGDGGREGGGSGSARDSEALPSSSAMPTKANTLERDIDKDSVWKKSKKEKEDNKKKGQAQRKHGNKEPAGSPWRQTRSSKSLVLQPLRVPPCVLCVVCVQCLMCRVVSCAAQLSLAMFSPLTGPFGCVLAAVDGVSLTVVNCIDHADSAKDTIDLKKVSAPISSCACRMRRVS